MTSLQLDSRRRAMLREMGVRVWPRGDDVATESIAARARIHWAKGQKGTENSTENRLNEDFVQADVAKPANSAAAIHSTRAANLPAGTQVRTLPADSSQPAAGQTASARPITAPSAKATGASPAWQFGDVCTPFHPGPAAGATTAHWLVLAETPAATLRAAAFDPLAGDAGKLLGNMLRAARLPQAESARLVPLARVAAGGAADTALQGAVAALIEAGPPNVVLLIMGRLAAQAVLQTSEPLGKLRGQVHALQGTAAVVTYDAGFLLRNPQDKGKAWDDLRLAMAQAGSASSIT